MGYTFTQNRNPGGIQCEYDKVTDYWSKAHVRCWFQAKVTICGKRYCNRHAPIILRGGKLAQVSASLLEEEVERFYAVAQFRKELPNEVIANLIRGYLSAYDVKEDT